MNNAHHSDRDPNLRASDADRDQVAQLLRDHHAEGRLDSEEMQERIDACYQAKTIGDLQALLHDLPRQQARQQPRHGDGFPFRLGFGRRRALRLLPIVIALIVLSIVTGHHFFWVAIPLFFLASRFLAPWCARRRARAGEHWA
jgi:hypothetical protein